MPPASMLDDLTSWMQAAGFGWNASEVILCGGHDNSGPFAVEACCDILEGHTLCKIPKSAVLSIRNSAIADLIEQEQLGGGLGLSLAVMYEASIGDKSKW